MTHLTRFEGSDLGVALVTLGLVKHDFFFRIILEKLRVVWWWVPWLRLVEVRTYSLWFHLVALTACWFAGSLVRVVSFLRVWFAFHKNSSPCFFFGLLGALRNALDSSWAAKEKLCLKNLNLLGIHGINMDQLRF